PPAPQTPVPIHHVCPRPVADAAARPASVARMHSTPLVDTPGAVVAEDVSKVFFSGTDPVWALEDFSLTLEPGSFTCIVGPSGCGKSTFLRILGGLEERTVGSVTMPEEGHAIPAAFVFQEHGVFP